MIFAVPGHIDLIKKGIKIYTRRTSGRYEKGHNYAIQPKRTKPGIPEGRVRIVSKQYEEKGNPNYEFPISKKQAWGEGKYTPKQFEASYEKLCKKWKWRWAYGILYIPTFVTIQSPITNFVEILGGSQCQKK